MTGKRLATLVVLLLFSISAFAQSYPPKKGVVSDYTGRLTPAQVTELAGLIKQYERQTSIEFAVVVVGDLQGQSAKEYAIGIGDAWGVGQAGRNNGIVLLWAPRERKYALRIAGGLSGDISDADAAAITGENLLPNFKSERYYAGLKQTIVATMEKLGNKTWEDRLQARTQAAAQRQQEQAQQAEEDQKNRRIVNGLVIGFLVLAGAGILTWFVVHRARRRSEERTELAEAGAVIADHLRVAETNAPHIQQLFNDLSKEMPEQDVSALSQNLAGQPGRILITKTEAQNLDYTNLGSYDAMVRIRTAAEAEAGLLGVMQQRVAQIRQAKAQSQALMAGLSKEPFDIQELRDNSRRDEVNRLLSTSRQNYEQARHNSSLSIVDWLIINSLLNDSRRQAQQAVQCSEEAPCVASSSSSDSSSSSFSSSDSFGGGSDFSSGSGSDGSY